jgi:hypothetical protein
MAKNGLPPVFSCTSCASGAPRSDSQRRASATNCPRCSRASSPSVISFTSAVFGNGQRPNGLDPSSFLSEYRSIFFRVPGAGCVEAGISRRTGGGEPKSECLVRYRTNSSSLRRALGSARSGPLDPKGSLACTPFLLRGGAFRFSSRWWCVVLDRSKGQRCPPVQRPLPHRVYSAVRPTD